MRNALIFILVMAALAGGAFLLRQQNPPGPDAGGGGGAGGGNAGAGIGAGMANVGGNSGGGGGGATLEQVLPIEKAREASPIWEGHASWPKPDTLPAFPEKPSNELAVAAMEVERDVQQWFSSALRWTRGVDGSQVYLKGVNATGSVTVLVGRNRMVAKGLYSVAFEAIFSDAVPVDAVNTIKRLKVVLGSEIGSEVEKRGIVDSPAVTGTEDFAGLVSLGQSGVGAVFPHFYCYAKPKQVVGVLQTIPSTYGKGLPGAK